MATSKFTVKKTRMVVLKKKGARMGITNPAPPRPAIYEHREEARRIDFLELMAWAIYQAECCENLQEFSKELRTTRRREWGELPWTGAKDAKRFLQHVTRMAEDFTAEQVHYRNRSHQPHKNGGRNRADADDD